MNAESTLSMPCTENALPDLACSSSSKQRGPVAYIMSRFPKITETFILREIIELERQGIEVEVYPLQRENTTLMQPDAAPYVARAHFTPFLSWQILKANFVAAFLQPIQFISTLATIIRANFGSVRYLSGALSFFPKAVYLASEMKLRGVRHVHAHFASHPAAVAFVIGRMAGIPFSYVAHGSDLHRDQHMLLEKTREAALVIAISEYNRQMIIGICGSEYEEKVEVLHCGVDLQRFLPRTEPTPYDRAVGPFRIVCVGTLHEVKGQTFLIEACRLLKDSGFDFSCHFMGGGSDEAELRKQTELAGLKERIKFHGSCTSDEIVKQLEIADVLVAPSVLSKDGRREGIPVVLMEAMASAVPCVASRLSGIPELVEDNVTGFLTPPGDASALAAALMKLAREPELRRQFGRNSVERVQKYFSLPTNTALLGEKLTKVMLPPSTKEGRQC